MWQNIDMEIDFTGRKKEIQALNKLQVGRLANLVVIKGRRRIGKSRLIQEFAKQKKSKFLSFSGLSPEKNLNAQDERDEFLRQLGQELGLQGIRMDNWGDIFTLLAKQVQNEKVIILLDEISWMGSKDPSFLGKLKIVWDLEFSKNPNLILILCGSVSAWIEENIINGTEFLGRISQSITLEGLDLNHCSKFWGKQSSKISAYEKLKVLSVIGAVPRYLELIDPQITAEANINRLCFTQGGALVNEYQNIFSDIFGKRSEIYKKIVSTLIKGPRSQEEILNLSERNKSGDLGRYLNDLILAGFISRDYTWHLKTGEVSKLSNYRIKDNYLRFCLKYIEPNKTKIAKGLFEKQNISSLKGWESILGLQFENLVLNNDLRIAELLNIPLNETIFLNPYFQKANKSQRGCQIDLMIQTKFNNVYICEIKFSKSPIKASIIKEMQKKIDAIKLPKNFSFRPVLIHVNGVSEEVIDAEYFAQIIDFSELL